jgi:hypothetical protein
MKLTGTESLCNSMAGSGLECWVNSDVENRQRGGDSPHLRYLAHFANFLEGLWRPFAHSHRDVFAWVPWKSSSVWRGWQHVWRGRSFVAMSG